METDLYQDQHERLTLAISLKNNRRNYEYQNNIDISRKV